MLFGKYASRASEAKYPSLWRGLVGAWSPGITGPTGVRAFDLSGRNKHGTATNVSLPTFWSRSQGRWGWQFNGSNNYIAISIDYRFNTPFTISGWFTQDALTLNKTIFSNWRIGTVGSVSNHGVFVEFSSAGLLRFAYRNNGTNIFDFSVSETYSANFWNHIAATYSGSLASLHLNGVQCVTTASATGFTTVEGRDFIVGALDPFGVNLGRFWNGLQSDVFVHSRALSHSEIRRLASRRGVLFEPKKLSFARSVDKKRRRNNALVGLF